MELSELDDLTDARLQAHALVQGLLDDVDAAPAGGVVLDGGRPPVVRLARDAAPQLRGRLAGRGGRVASDEADGDDLRPLVPLQR